jgi:TRAP-type uncharacterized transport system substrate-binding protein
VQADLRSVFGLYAEAFTVMAAADVGAKDFADLKGPQSESWNCG